APTSGLRAAYRVRTVATLSGPGAASLQPSQRSASIVTGYVLEVAAVRDASFDVRITSELIDAVVTGEFARDWTPLRFGMVDQGRYADVDAATFPVVGESVRILRDLAGSWRPGERRSWRWTRHLPPYLEIGLQGTVALTK